MHEGKDIVEITKEDLYIQLKKAFHDGVAIRGCYTDGDEGTLAAQEEGWYASDTRQECEYFEEYQ